MGCCLCVVCCFLTRKQVISGSGIFTEGACVCLGAIHIQPSSNAKRATSASVPLPSLRCVRVLVVIVCLELAVVVANMLWPIAVGLSEQKPSNHTHADTGGSSHARAILL